MEKADEKKEKGQKRFSRLRNLYKRINSIAKRILKRDEPEKKDEGKDRLKGLLDRIDQSNKHLDLNLIPEDIQGDFHSQIRRLATEGFNDGVVGLRTESHRSFAKVKSEGMCLQYMGTLSEKQKMLDKEITSKNKVMDDKMKQVKQHHDYQNYLQHHYKFNERGNTIWEFILYFICFLFIFLADIPLAAEMLKRLFDTNMGSKPIAFNTIRENWSAIITAVGISVSTIYIKVCYDEFAARKYGHAVISQKKFEELFMENGSPNRELDITEKAKIIKNERVVRIIKISLFLYTVATIVMVGIFRGFAWMQKIGQGSVPISLISITLIFITLLFSLISGVCLSISLSALTTYRRLRNCRKEAIDLEKTYLEATKDVAISEGKQAYVERVIEKMDKGQEWINNTSQLMISYYDLGYDEGYADPGYFMRHLDYFDRILFWREQAIAGKINANINK